MSLPMNTITDTLTFDWPHFIAQHHMEWQDWRWHMRHAAKKAEDFVSWGIMSATEAQKAQSCMQRYQTFVTPYYLSLINVDDKQCPIALQALPKQEELSHLPLEDKDPIGDQAHRVTPLLIHRYPDRALLFPTYKCPMYCRYCFRKDALSNEKIHLNRDMQQTLKYLKDHPQIREVILSGGDPLILTDQRIHSLIQQLNDTGISRIRIHSRFPVTLPQRVTSALTASLSSKIPIALITHFNHSQELTPLAQQAIQRLRNAGIMLFNQSVLLAQVNDNVETLRTLFQQLFYLGITPYYLHHPDLTAGTQHFRVSLDQGLKIMKTIKASISGLALPQYVIDIPGGKGKVAVDSSYVQRKSATMWTLQSPLDDSLTMYQDLSYEYK
jgi:lysine 2,3-aminomutase